MTLADFAHSFSAKLLSLSPGSPYFPLSHNTKPRLHPLAGPVNTF